MSSAFARFIEERKASSRLERIVIDECHTILDSDEKWRPKVRELRKMAQKGVQVVYLTATLPPSDERAFFDAVGVEEQQMHMIRDKTVRPNVAYKVIQYDRGQEDEAIKSLVESKLEEHPDPGQIVIYCGTKDRTRKIADLLGCPAYYRGAGSAEEKRRILRRFTTQEERVIAATNALGLGVDIPTVRVVIHVGVCQKMKQYSQESGRAGRDGKASEAIIMQATWKDRNGRTKTDRGYRTDGAMSSYIQNRRCRRVTIDSYIDGRSGRIGCEEGERRCDVCRGEQSEATGRRIVVQNRGQSEGTGRRVIIQNKRRSDSVEVTTGVVNEEEEIEGDRESEGQRASEEDREIKEDNRGDLRGKRKDRDTGVEEEVKRQEDEDRTDRGDGWKRRRVEKEFKEVEERERERRMKDATAEVSFEQKLEKHKGDCQFCVTAGRESSRHQTWRECTYEEEEKKKGRAERVRAEIEKWKMEEFGGCGHCSAPQSICHRWEEYNGTGGQSWRLREGGKCQFEGVIVDTVAATLAGMSRQEKEEVVDFVIREGGKKGIEVRKEGKMLEIVREWGRRRDRIGSVETSGLGRLFYEFGL